MNKAFEKIIERLETELHLADAEKEICARENQLQFDSAKGYANGIAVAIEIVKEVAEEYKDKFVSMGAYKQVAWERDIAIKQLHELGYEFGEKIDGKDINVGNNEYIKMTNAERIRSMSDEELVDFLPIAFDLICNPTEECMMVACYHGECVKTKECALKWLQKEAEV